MDDSAQCSVSLFAGRIISLDVMRGVVMVLMALDHVRVYSGIPAGGPTAGIFFTRWVTHFCAPAFVFSPARRPFYMDERWATEVLSRATSLPEVFFWFFSN